MKKLILALFVVAAGFAADIPAQTETSISAIQGTGNFSPLDGRQTGVRGIVTARTRTGFFIQSPDDKTDSDANSSEGLFVYSRNEPPAEAAVGNLILITGTVNEFRPRSEPNTLSLTQLSFFQDRDTIRVLTKGMPLPKPVEITAADMRTNRIDQLEKLEGMRVTVTNMTVVSPTDGRFDDKSGNSVSNGIFYGVPDGVGRTYREPGLEVFETVFLTDKERDSLRSKLPELAIFDGNPERIRVESSAQLGSQPIDIEAYSSLSAITGVLHYAYRTYTIFSDPALKLTVSKGVKRTPLPVPSARQFTVAAMNIENFFDDRDDPAINEVIVDTAGFARRTKKVSMAIREHLNFADVIGIAEAENLEALTRLADAVNSDAVAAGGPDPKYKAFLIDDNDGRGIDNGFLVKTSGVKVLEIKQFGKEEKYLNPDTKEQNFLNDRPPLMLRAAVEDGKSGQPFEFTVVANHLKSFGGYNDPKQKANVRMKKRLQAEYLAKWVQGRQKADPAERIILVGDFNMYQFNDGITDLMGTIAGKPAGGNAVENPSADMVDPDMINLVDLIKPLERYSYIFDGNSQVLDHILVTANLTRHLNGFGYARLNADFPEVYRNDATRVERFSDHDPSIAYFSLDERK